MHTFTCPTCKKQIQALGSSASCVGKPGVPPAKGTQHPRTTMTRS